MTDAADIFARLAAPFPPEEVEWRVGSTNKKQFESGKTTGQKRGKPFCYVDARTVMDRLDEVMGSHWQCRYVPMPNGTACCEIGLLIEGDWLWRSNGAGATDMEGEKGAYSGAFKRAAVPWGVGRYLYTIKSGWIDLDDYWAIPKSAYAGLRALLKRNSEPPKSARQAHKDGDYRRIEGALRGAKTLHVLSTIWKHEQPVIAQWPDVWRESITEEKDACKVRLETMANSASSAAA